MPRTMVGRFATQAAAEQVAHELETLVSEPREIQVIDETALRERHEPGADEGFWDRLMEEVRSATTDEADDQAARSGPVYLIVTTDAERGSLARDIMAQSGLAERLEEYVVLAA